MGATWVACSALYLCVLRAGKIGQQRQMLEQAKAGLTTLPAIQRAQAQMDRPVICAGRRTARHQSTANLLAAALPHASWDLGAGHKRSRQPSGKFWI